MARVNQQKLADGQYMEIAYEKLTQKPEQALRAVCQFLDLPYNHSVLTSSMPHMGDKLSNEKGKIIANSDKWKEYFNQDIVASLEAIAGKMLHAYDYEVSNPDGCMVPGKSSRAYWLVHDRVSSMVCEYRRYGPRHLRVVSRRIRDSLIQLRTNKY